MIPPRNGQAVVLSLYDYTGAMVEPWARAGYACYILDMQHSAEGSAPVFFESGGFIQPVHWDADAPYSDVSLVRSWKNCGSKIAMVFGFPPCNDMAVSGAKHFAAKAAKDPDFQNKAQRRARIVQHVGRGLGAPWMVENPVPVLATLWRKPNYIFHPHEYGLYLKYSEGPHPIWPDVIPEYDAYTKKTCLWTSDDFIMPPKVTMPRWMINGGEETSPQFRKLGGKSLKTKNIRSATPRGFAKAVYTHNCPLRKAIREAMAA